MDGPGPTSPSRLVYIGTHAGHALLHAAFWRWPVLAADLRQAPLTGAGAPEGPTSYEQVCGAAVPLPSWSASIACA
jgi:hypothetical protein